MVERAKEGRGERVVRAGGGRDVGPTEITGTGHCEGCTTGACVMSITVVRHPVLIGSDMLLPCSDRSANTKNLRLLCRSSSHC